MITTRARLLSKATRRPFPTPLWVGLPAALLLLLPIASTLRAAEEDEIPPPIELDESELHTDDGVLLSATYYGSNKGEDAVPVVLLHSWKGSRKEYAGLAPYLQQGGFAVLVPDLRGHGESTTQVRGRARRELDAAKLRPDDLKLMATKDMEAIKRFLVQENDNGKLNVNKLSVVGVEMGASVALGFALYDWMFQDLVGKKQSRDVKALVLLSPQFAFRGLDVRPALSHPMVRSELSMFIVVGEDDSRAKAEAKRVYDMLKRYHPDPANPADRDLFYAPLPTKLQGSKLLDVQGMSLDSNIAKFLDLRVVKQSHPWIERRADGR